MSAVIDCRRRCLHLWNMEITEGQIKSNYQPLFRVFSRVLNTSACFIVSRAKLFLFRSLRLAFACSTVWMSPDDQIAVLFIFSPLLNETLSEIFNWFSIFASKRWHRKSILGWLYFVANFRCQPKVLVFKASPQLIVFYGCFGAWDGFEYLGLLSGFYFVSARHRFVDDFYYFAFAKFKLN